MRIHNKVKVLVLSHLYPNITHPNLGIFVHNQFKHIVKEDCEVRIVSPVPYVPRILWFRSKWKDYGQIPEKDEIDGIPVNYPRYINLPGVWFHSLSAYSIYAGIKASVTSIMKEFKPDIIHAHMATADGYVGLILRKKYNVPLACTLRGCDINTYPSYNKLTLYQTKRLLSEADQLISVSNKLKKVAMSIEKSKRNIEVVYNGCDFHSFMHNDEDSVKIRKICNISINDIIIIFVGRLEKEKGILELFQAFRTLGSNNDKLHLVLVGDCVESDVKNEISKLNDLNSNVHLTGIQPHKIVFKWLKSADLFVLPSHREGLPNAVIEAMSCGLPVVATNVGGIPEIVEDGKTGILVNPKDAESLTKAIDFIINNDDVATEMGMAGRKKIEKEFSWQKSAREICRIYNKVLSRN